MSLHHCEVEVKNLPPLKNKYLDFEPCEVILKAHDYHPHLGLRPKCKHWRKAKDDGCFHITIHKDGNIRMHWDAWDPRRYPVKHFFEVLYRYFRFPLLYLNEI